VWSYYVFGGRQVAVRVTPASGPSDTGYLHREHLGSTAARMDSAGATEGYRRYEPFGENRGQTGTLNVHYLYTGQMTENYLYYYGARRRQSGRRPG